MIELKVTRFDKIDGNIFSEKNDITQLRLKDGPMVLSGGFIANVHLREHRIA